MTVAQKLESALPDREQADLARESAAELSKLLANRPEIARARIQFDDTDLVLPRQAITLLRDLLAEMAQGNAVAVIPTHQELTTQQAADLLNVSRPHLIKLLEEGKLPFTKAGSHRRIRFEELLKYKEERDLRSQNAMDELAKQAQELNMGY
ncbi:DNA-binding protein [Acidihalobacter yilgarnensis]|uniref:DNA-binding protein n=1 Tax=Acidihalobacter yilgarnensis TaxID=2819280 RepID=A0A1D8ISE6_9GAMM|nr:helix-turn-helix domain-containing protein [Acidihalobacter yilgarnensis]AOU99327.1 DNA-binding protein [Acidihalobacter yilgarnensis]